MASAEPAVSTEENQGSTEITEESVKDEGEDNTVCQFFMMGKCHFGHRCRLSHSNPSLDDCQVVVPDHDKEGQSEEKMGKLKKNKYKVNKAAKPKHADDGDRKEVSKKPRMRTADEVISRILWDLPVEASDFVVGYVDRFLGVLERPFNEFNWEANPCDCDYSAELALPRHRIQYFIYRGLRVWDRNSRTDRVFGSTGQSLAPPFGWKKEVEERGMQGDGVLEPRDEQLPVPEHESEGTHLQDENNYINVNTPNSKRSDSGDRGCLVSHQAAAGDSRPIVEEAINGLQTLTAEVSLTEENIEKDGKEDEDKACEEWKESPGINDEEQSHQGNVRIDRCPSPPQEKRGFRPPKLRPTHFICFRANTPTILSGFKRLQEEATSLLPSSAPHWIASSTLHVTLCLLVLRGPAEVASAGELLRRFAQLDRNPPVAVSFPLKLKHFSGRVLYLNPQPHLLLQQLNSGLQEAYRKEGWLHRHSFNPHYHLTLAKMDSVGERIFHGVGDMKVGKGFNFGRLPVNILHLCAMGKSSTADFYETLCTVSLR